MQRLVRSWKEPGSRPLCRDRFQALLLPVRDGLWRVTTVSGAILGHIERGESGAERGQRFTARALLSDGVHYSELGEFGDAQTAAECFR